MADKTKYTSGQDAGTGNIICWDDSSLNSNSWKEMQILMNKSVQAGSLFSKDLVSTYSLVYTNASGAYLSGILAPNGDIHFVPYAAAVGQKISSGGSVSTYSLVYTKSSGAYYGGVLAPNGDIHFIPYNAPVGQKISAAGTVSTYSLIYTGPNAYIGGVLAFNGDIYFVPASAKVGQKISTLPAEPFSQAICQSPFFNKF